MRCPGWWERARRSGAVFSVAKLLGVRVRGSNEFVLSAPPSASSQLSLVNLAAPARPAPPLPHTPAAATQNIKSVYPREAPRVRPRRNRTFLIISHFLNVSCFQLFRFFSWLSFLLLITFYFEILFACDCFIFTSIRRTFCGVFFSSGDDNMHLMCHIIIRKRCGSADIVHAFIFLF